MSPSQAGPSSALSRYRPFFYLLSGVVAAYAVVYIHHNFISPAYSDSQPSSLRRRNAVRRQRRNEPDDIAVVDTPSYRAIAHLEQLEHQNGVYGTFRIETEDGRRVESGLLPSLLATRDQLMDEVGVPQAHAERMREMMEDTFLESFLALDFPPEHTLLEGSPERTYLSEQLQRRGISQAGVERALAQFNENENYGEELRHRRQNGERVTLSTSSVPDASAEAQAGVQNMDGAETVVDDQSVFSWRDGHNDSSPTREGQNLLNLLYHIAEDQARRDGYIHRGVTCNSCNAMPIQGIRYRCANCIDYDLCETCEAMQVHIKTHLFYKVRIPAPFLGNPRQSQPVWYPGKPSMLPRSLPRSLAKRLMKETGFENTELDALWDQFRCLANYEWPEDPNKLYMAIDRKTFDRCFVPNTSVRPPPPSLIYDRMFAFYDTNNDDLIGFEEFLKGLASLNNKSNDERLRRVFRGYDINGDGYVERKDFLRVFRAYYTLSRELTRDMVAGMEDDFLEGGARDVVLGGQPISSAFPGSIPSGEPSRMNEGKRINSEGDADIVDNEGILRQDGADTGDRYQIVGEAAVRGEFGRLRHVPVRVTTTEHRPQPPPVDGTHTETEDEDEDEGGGSSDEDASSSSVTSDNWPPAEHILEEDIVNALGAVVPLQEVTDPVDRARIGTAVYHRMWNDDQRRVSETRRHGIDERWRRRVFYTDEEDGATMPPGYERDPDFDGTTDEDDESEDGDADEDAIDEQQAASESHPPSPRSRSSSKVRFQDDLDDLEVRSTTSSRSIPVGERWGGFEVPEVERDIGKEVLYQATQQGFNELLDILFKPKEDLLMQVYRTRTERKIWAREIERFEKRRQRNGSGEIEVLGKDANEYIEKIVNEMLERSSYSMQNPSFDPVRADAGAGADDANRPVLAPPSPELRVSDVYDDDDDEDEDFDEDDYDDGDDGDDDDDDVRPTHLAHPDEEEEILIEDGDEEQDEDHHHHSRGLIEPIPIRPVTPELQTSQYESQHPSSTLPEFDPTLPQHRPDATAIATPTNNNGLPLPLRLQPNPSLPSYSPEAEATAPKQPPSPIHALPPPSSASPSLSPSPSHARVHGKAQHPLAPPSPERPPPRPSSRTLSRWAFLNQVEREGKERGGTGARLNFEEFSKRMAVDRGRRLAFVASWIEMASF